MGGSFRATLTFLGMGVFAMIFLALGLCGAYGFYRHILLFYGLFSLLLSLVFLVGFIVVLVEVFQTDPFTTACKRFAEETGEDSWDADHCGKYFEAIKPAAEGVCAMSLVIAGLLAMSSYLAFKLRTFSASVPVKTQRYESALTG